MNNRLFEIPLFIITTAICVSCSLLYSQPDNAPDSSVVQADEGLLTHQDNDLNAIRLMQRATLELSMWPNHNLQLIDVDVLPQALTEMKYIHLDTSNLITWRLKDEVHVLGFHVLRSESPNGAFRRMNSELIKGSDDSRQNASFRFSDSSIKADASYFYKLVAMDLDGSSQESMPIQISGSSESSQFILEQNFPNPFNPKTAIGVQINKFGRVNLRVFDINGRLVRKLVDENLPAGYYQADWDGRDESGQLLASGVYLYTLEYDGFKETKQMTMLR